MIKVITIPLWYLCNFSTRYKNVDKAMQLDIVRIPQCSAQQAQELDVENGDIPVYTSGASVYHTTRDIAGEYVCDIPLAIGIGNALSTNTIKLLKAPFVCANNHIAIVRDEDIVLPEFLYNILKYSVKIEKYFRGVTLKTACMDEILKIGIPVPEMWYQKQIVEWFRQTERNCDNYQRQIDALDKTIYELINHGR